MTDRLLNINLKPDQDFAEENEPPEKLVSLTFDDGPNTGITVEVLDLLERHGIVASFFLIGQNINEETAKVVKRAFDLGCDIQNHSFTHSDMRELSAEQIKEEIKATDDKIIEITGVKPTFFRPPYIYTNNTMYKSVGKPFICGENCRDWEIDYPTKNRIADLKNVIRDGTLVLLHDLPYNKSTVETLEEIIPWLLRNNYRFVTCSDMFTLKGVVPKTTKMYSVVE